MTDKRHMPRLQLHRGMSYRYGHLHFKRGTPVDIKNNQGQPDEGLYHQLLQTRRLTDPDQQFGYMAPHALDRLHKPSEIVIIRDMGLGDVLMVSLSLREMAKKFPQHSFVYATSTAYVPLFRDCKFLKEVISIPSLTGVRQFVVDLRGYSERAEQRLVRDRIDLFADHLRVVIQDYTFPFSIRDSELEKASARIYEHTKPRPWVGLTIRGSTAVRTWPYGHLTEFCRQATAMGWTPVLLDHERFAMEVPGVVNLTNKLSIMELAATIKACDIMIGPDTGNIHLSEAVGTPCVALYSTIPPALRLGHYRHVRAIWKGGPGGEVECSPCFDNGCNHLSCLTKITPEEVMNVCEEMMASSGRLVA